MAFRDGISGQKPCSISRIIAAPDRNKLGQSRSQDSTKQVSQTFNLFDNFTFSNPNYDVEAAAGSNYYKNPVQKSSGPVKTHWEEEVTHRFSNINLHQGKVPSLDPKESLLHSQAPDFVPKGKYVTQFNKPQQFVITDSRGFQGIPNGVPFVCGNYPGYCVYQPQGTFVEPWALRNIPHFAPHSANQTPFYVNISDECHSYYQNNMMSCRSDVCNLNCINPNFKCQETVPAIEAGKQDQQCEEYKPKGKNYKTKASLPAKAVKPLKKVGFPKFSRRRNFPQETTDENNFIFSTTPNPIPKGARPILSARK